MPLGADKIIKVHNLYYNPETDEETEVVTSLTNVSVHAKTVATATVQGLSAASIAQFRIFPSLAWSAPQTASGTVSPASGKFVDPAQWATQSPASAALTWTLRPGDKIEFAGQLLTILAVHDNRNGRRNPHWYVEAH